MGADYLVAGFRASCGASLNVAQDLRQAAISSFRMLLRPVVGLMLRCGVSWKEASEALRLVYVSVASEEYAKHGRPANISRIAILTDMSRRDVRKVSKLLEQDIDTVSQSLLRMSRATQVLSAWFQDPDFTDAKGRPRLLKLKGPGGFEELLQRHAPDIPITAMYKELKQAGAVRETPSGRIRAVSRAFIPSPLDPDGVIRAGEVIGDLTRTLSHNLADTDRAPGFERRAMSRRVVRVSRRAFDRYLESRGMDFLEEIDAWLVDHESDNTERRVMRLGVGVYLIAED
jgi:hypothetical protein